MLDPEQKVKLGQFMTPAPVADFMASLFSPTDAPIRLLDAGAGIGSLTAAFLKRWQHSDVAVTAYEIDETMLSYLRQHLSSPAHDIIAEDFIEHGIHRLMLGNRGRHFTHAILNPPYKKINSDSRHRALLRVMRLETVNLYTAFVGLALELLTDGGELVAIIPRSFCNGPYYRPFRDWIASRASLEHIHLFHSRTSAFTDDDVLRENVIIKCVRGKPQGPVTVSTTGGATFDHPETHSYEYADIVHPDDIEGFIHIPTSPDHCGLHGVPLATCTLPELGLEVSTGPVVDFRLKEFLRLTPEDGTVPLIYPTHFVHGGLVWPRDCKKPNALKDDRETRKWLYPNGFYTIVRRFSSKEERRRIVAYVIDPADFAADMLGFENHLNVYHAGRRGIDRVVAHGLSVFLNSTPVDDYFRRFSGHTQVNATDLRLLQYPTIEELKTLGQWAITHPQRTQAHIDEQVAALDAQEGSHRGRHKSS